MKKVLIVSLAFPPLPVVGVYRVSKFCKYFPEMGWQPYVLTEKVRDVKPEKDWATLKDIGDEIKITRTLNLQPFYWWDNRPKKKQSIEARAPKDSSNVPETTLPRISLRRILKSGVRLLRNTLTVPDARMAWIPQALIPGLRLIRREKIDVVFSSSPNPTNHIMGYLLSKFTGRPHILDYRDLWTLNGGYFIRELPGFLQTLDAFIERTILNHCRGVVVATNTFRDNMLAGFKDVDLSGKITVIYNGVDETDYRSIDTEPPPNNKFTINYFGNLYSFRNPDLFLSPFAEWVNNNPDIRTKLKVDFWGSNSPEFLVNAFAHNLDDIISFNPRIPQKDVITKLFQTDLLLLIQGLDPRVNDAIPTKLFEYMATGKPILAFFPEGEAASILKEQEKHLAVSYPDDETIIAYLQRQFDLWKNNPGHRQVAVGIPARFNRRNQTKQLAEFINGLLED